MTTWTFRQGLVAWNDGSFESLAQHNWHPDITLHDMPEMPDAGEHRGRDAALRRFAAYTEPLGHFNLELEEALEVGDAMFFVAALTGLSPAAEVPVRSRVFYISRYLDARVIELRVFSERAPALAAAESADE